MSSPIFCEPKVDECAIDQLTSKTSSLFPLPKDEAAETLRCLEKIKGETSLQ